MIGGLKQSEKTMEQKSYLWLYRGSEKDAYLEI